MAIDMRDFLAQLPDSERQAIEARTAELIAEEATLRDPREASRRSPGQIAEQWGIQQAAVSKLGRRTDMYVSTLRDVIHALGGELEIVARFPDRPPVRITQFRKLRG